MLQDALKFLEIVTAAIPPNPAVCAHTFTMVVKDGKPTLRLTIPDDGIFWAYHFDDSDLKRSPSELAADLLALHATRAIPADTTALPQATLAPIE